MNARRCSCAEVVVFSGNSEPLLDESGSRAFRILSVEYNGSAKWIVIGDKHWIGACRIRHDIVVFISFLGVREGFTSS